MDVERLRKPMQAVEDKLLQLAGIKPGQTWCRSGGRTGSARHKHLVLPYFEFRLEARAEV